MSFHIRIIKEEPILGNLLVKIIKICTLNLNSKLYPKNLVVERVVEGVVVTIRERGLMCSIDFGTRRF